MIRYERLYGSGIWTPPYGVTLLLGVAALGGAVGGTHGGFFPAKGGGGGACSARYNVAIAALTGQSYSVGPGYISPNGINQGDGGDTWMGDANPLLAACIVLADGGGAYTGGSAAIGKGTIKYNGGDSGHPVINGKGPGGGGAAGINGAGGDGTSTHGGSGDGGTVAGGFNTGGVPDFAGLDGSGLFGSLFGPGSAGASGTTPGKGGDNAAGGGGGEGVDGAHPGVGALILWYDQPVEFIQGHIHG